MKKRLNIMFALFMLFAGMTTADISIAQDLPSKFEQYQNDRTCRLAQERHDLTLIYSWRVER